MQQLNASLRALKFLFNWPLFLQLLQARPVLQARCPSCRPPIALSKYCR